LLRLALESRPDVKAERLGLEYDRATVQAERAETFDDAIVFYSPFEAQNFVHQGKRSVTSWGGGAGTILPILDRNQGEIARARINVSQTEIELRGLERRVAHEVLRARTDYSRPGNPQGRGRHPLRRAAQ
jgi:cobalt-zinc-cadmium efflux system outer membrane protein